MHSLQLCIYRGIIATGGADTNAVVFDLLSRKTVSSLSGHSEKVFPALLNFCFSFISSSFTYV